MDGDVDSAELEKLTDVFRKAGAPNPESWARSQLAEGIPQLSIFSLAKSLWTGVNDENDVNVIKARAQFAKENPDRPLSQADVAIKDMLAKGVAPETVIDLIRSAQYEAIFNTICILDGTVDVDTPAQDWAIYQINDDGEPIVELNGVHEVLLSLDPTGREMRPRPKSSQ